MSDPARERPFRLEIAGLPEPFVVVAFTGSEAISEPYVFEAQVLISDPTLDLAGLLYRSVWLSFGAAGRGIHGQLHELVQDRHGVGCHVRIGPKLACLAQRFSQRVFNARSVPQIIRQVLKEHGISGRDICLDLSSDYAAQDFCTQYRESDLQFLQRVCAQAGVHFYFEPGRDRHGVVFADTVGSVSATHKAVYSSQGQAATVQAFRVDIDVSRRQVARGQSDLMHLHGGRTLSLVAHPYEDWNQRWLLIQVEHRGQGDAYSNHFRAIPRGLPFVADSVPEKPVMVSRQRGWVVDVAESAGQVAGRVAVQFDWVYQGEGASPSHCWLPLAPELAASAVEGIREGTEVLVSFIEGDPDRPLISAFLGPTAKAATSRDSLSSATLKDTPMPQGVDSPLLSAIQEGEPLILLCLLPGGGRFSPCAQSICTCRMVTGAAQ
ncbi:contractile injection system protein, VgrG/Pvc8 family [Pseudomonas sp. SAICEU22]|uniref:Contractile injection system protein, VgrG/Pvc8 family n=1 Tax=Pseudomonas agronomica TaxID=2979328 RepID=A0ABT3FCI9_9PSED|nr:contractile injection system protein, VgrG/Pvc8 family [Pseudomonas agronomica]MCW1246677.1 contractile injection system protein, VgrG/Pvc8 family [Pseudomonas agronomica]